MNNKYDVEKEFLDENDNVVDSTQILQTDDYNEAVKAAGTVELSSDREQVAIWEWDEKQECVVDSTVVKEYEPNEETVDREYLIRNDFKKDNHCPEGVNRWGKKDGEMGCRNYAVSVTLSEDGKQTIYGVVNFYTTAISKLSFAGYYEYISLHRYFNGKITVKDFERMLDRNAEWKNRNPKDETR